MSGEPAVYWDTCVFLAWVKDEDRAPDEKAGIQECIDDVQNGRLTLITSSITRVEVLACKAADAERAVRFNSLLLRPEVVEVALDRRIAELAHDIRNYYQVRCEAGESRPLTVPDAVHLATAIQYQAHQFHTFDDGRNSKYVGLLALNGNVAEHSLTIVQPGAVQLRLV